jgi:hypothetical protein
VVYGASHRAGQLGETGSPRAERGRRISPFGQLGLWGSSSGVQDVSASITYIFVSVCSGFQSFKGVSGEPLYWWVHTTQDLYNRIQIRHHANKIRQIQSK